MAESFNPHSDKRQAWSLSELKETYIDIFQLFIRSRINYLNAIRGTGDPHLAKIEYISSLDAYYQVSQAPFESFLKSKFPDDWEKIIEKYDDIAVLGIDMSDDELRKMGNYINKWNTRDGFMRLNDNVLEFNDPFEAVEYFEQNR